MTGLRSIRFAGEPLLEACLADGATVHLGMSGGAVARVQQALMELGFSLKDYGPDGVFGPETGGAVAAFQLDYGLPSCDHIVDSATMRALDACYEAERPVALDAGGVPQSGRLPPGGDFPRAAVELALAQAAAEAHYLLGTVGTPATLASARTDPVDPAVFAAQWDGHVCAGRFNARNGGIAGGRRAASTDTDLLVYLAGLASQAEELWTPFFQFFSPRRVGRDVVWGEDCRAKLHFDGPGLVNWCFEQVIGTSLAFGIEAWATDASGTSAVELDEAPRTGDIVVRAIDGRFTHIGFLVGDGHVVLAEQAGVGVVVRRFSPAGWTFRRQVTSTGEET
jgi:cell wall-associated NlpC family hydrolase